MSTTFRYPTFELSDSIAQVICLFGRKTLKFEADTLFYTNLNSNFQTLPNMSYKGQFGEICVTKLRCKNSIT